MSQFSSAITALNSESKFAQAYSAGVHKSKYWEVSEDCLAAELELVRNLVAHGDAREGK